MKRYSLLWWAVILPTSLVVGLPTFLVIGQLTDWAILQRIAVALVAILAADLAIAASMEAVAPTKIKIGPGERHLKSETPADTATVVSGFESSPYGRVMVRGETWLATRLPGETGVMSAGTIVQIVDRNGLNLVVTSNRD
jgi:membrane protein implicated in regulation of membrane protease activity